MMAERATSSEKSTTDRHGTADSPRTRWCDQSRKRATRGSPATAVVMATEGLNTPAITAPGSATARLNGESGVGPCPSRRDKQPAAHTARAPSPTLGPRYESTVAFYQCDRRSSLAPRRLRDLAPVAAGRARGLASPPGAPRRRRRRSPHRGASVSASVSASVGPPGRAAGARCVCYCLSRGS